MRAVILVVVLAACGEHASPKSQQASVTVAAPSASTTVCNAAPSASYEPHPAWAGRPAAIEDPPTIPADAQRVGDAYTIYGALRALHAIDSHELLAHDITVVGFIVDTNIARAPKCALHHTGHADPEGCVTEIPTFTISDDAHARPDAPRIRVMGWASNFSNVFEAQLKDRAHDTSRLLDELWATEIPRPLPSVGAKVKLTGTYGVSFTKSSSGLESDPRSGVFTVKRTEYIH